MPHSSAPHRGDTARAGGSSRAILPDALLIPLSVAFGWASLAYPFGRDQGLYYYVAREWVLRGAIPYRDVLDHKTPGIYILHALCIRVLGEQMYGIRILDLACVVGVGLVAASLSAERGARVLPGVRGLACLTTSVLFYGFLNFWDTAQSELWYSLLGIGAVWAIRRIEREPRAQAVAGLFAGAAMMMKPPAVWLVMLAVGCLVARVVHAREGASLAARAKASLAPAIRGLVLFGAGFCVTPALVFAYFGAHHAMAAMFDIVVGANSYYVTHERSSTSKLEMLGWVFEYLWIYFPLSLVAFLSVVVGSVQARRLRDPELGARYAIAVLACLAALLAVYMQGKFFLLHWTVMIGPAAIVGANVARAFIAFASRRARLPAPARAYAGIVGFVVVLFALYVPSAYTVGGPRMWLDANKAALRWVRGEARRDELSSHFSMPQVSFDFASSERVGLFLREHTGPDDFVAVRGFQPEIYAVAGRRYPGRFFWTTFLTNPSRAYRREEWLREDREALAAHPPKYVVTLTAIKEGPDSTAWFLPLGYEVAKELHDTAPPLTVLHRISPP